MAGKIPNNIWLYRIVHLNNIGHILNYGLCVKGHKDADPNYIDIGDNKLIQQRNDYVVNIDPPNGVLGEYVPFYFGPLSPMLLNIKTGHRGITQRPQEDIVYFCCNLNALINSGSAWCFTDGHAKDALTVFYNDVAQLDRVDLGIVKERYWSNTEEYTDRMRKKQAEFLVKSFVPVKCIENIVVYNDKTLLIVQQLLDKLQLKIKVWVNPNSKFYY